MTSDLFSGLGLTMVDPYVDNTRLKQLKPQDDSQVFALIGPEFVPNLPNYCVVS